MVIDIPVGSVQAPIDCASCMKWATRLVNNYLPFAASTKILFHRDFKVSV